LLKYLASSKVTRILNQTLMCIAVELVC